MTIESAGGRPIVDFLVDYNLANVGGNVTAAPPGCSGLGWYRVSEVL